mgnify:CR=1 FL=1
MGRAATVSGKPPSGNQSNWLRPAKRSGWAGSAAGEVEMSLVVKVYGNDNKLIDEYEFAAEDFADVLF